MEREEEIMKQSIEALKRLSLRHNEEWDEILIKSQRALESARTVKEIKAISKEYKRKFDDLRKKQKEETIQLQDEYMDKLLSL